MGMLVLGDGGGDRNVMVDGNLVLVMINEVLGGGEYTVLHV
jgi:hypothetical protein